MIWWYTLRLWALLLLEVAAFGGMSGALLLGARFYHTALTPAAHAATRPAPAGPLTPAAGLQVAETAAGTFMGMSDTDLLGRMRGAEVRSLRFNRGGSSVSFKVDFKDGTRASFKPVQINPQSVPRKEVAAYRISRLLGLHLIPPATMRTLSKEEVLGKLAPESAFMRPRVEAETVFENGAVSGVLSYWIPTIINMGLDSKEGVERWTEWLTVGNPIPPDKMLVAAQLSDLLIFDLVQNNSDRWSGGNLMGSPDGKALYYMDNAFGFQTDAEGHQRCRSYLQRAQKFSRRLVAALRRLDQASLKKALSEEQGPPLLTDEEISALLSRRDHALRHVDRLQKEHGEDQVLVFP